MPKCNIIDSGDLASQPASIYLSLAQLYGYNAFKQNMRKKLQAVDKNLKPAIYAKCYDCMGFYEDSA